MEEEWPPTAVEQVAESGGHRDDPEGQGRADDAGGGGGDPEGHSGAGATEDLGGAEVMVGA